LKTIAIIFFTIMLGLLLHSQLAHAQEIHKWIDEKGNVHFTDDPSTIKSSVEPENAATRIGDELARQRLLKEARPNLKLPQRSYYEAHPEDRYLDQVHEINKELMKVKNPRNWTGPLPPPPSTPNPAPPPRPPTPPPPQPSFFWDVGDGVVDSQTGVWSPKSR